MFIYVFLPLKKEGIEKHLSTELADVQEVCLEKG